MVPEGGELHLGHPVALHLIESEPHVLAPVVHRELKLGHGLCKEGFGSAGDDYIFEAPEGHFAHLGVLVGKICRQPDHHELHVVASRRRQLSRQ